MCVLLCFYFSALARGIGGGLSYYKQIFNLFERELLTNCRVFWYSCVVCECFFNNIDLASRRIQIKLIFDFLCPLIMWELSITFVPIINFCRKYIIAEPNAVLLAMVIRYREFDTLRCNKYKLLIEVCMT